MLHVILQNVLTFLFAALPKAVLQLLALFDDPKALPSLLEHLEASFQQACFSFLHLLLLDILLGREFLQEAFVKRLKR